MKSCKPAAALCVLTCCGAAPMAHAQEKFPLKNIRMLVPFAPDALNNVIGGNVQFNFAPVIIAAGARVN